MVYTNVLFTPHYCQKQHNGPFFDIHEVFNFRGMYFFLRKRNVCMEKNIYIYRYRFKEIFTWQVLENLGVEEKGSEKNQKNQMVLGKRSLGKNSVEKISLGKYPLQKISPILNCIDSVIVIFWVAFDFLLCDIQNTVIF